MTRGAAAGAPEVRCVVRGPALLGEGPVWCPVEQCLWWVDIPGSTLHRYEPSSGWTGSWPMPQHAGSLALREAGGVLVALRSAVGLLDPATSALSLLDAPESDRPETRFNDGKCDRQGRFWVGTMRTEGEPAARQAEGALYRLDPDFRWHRVLDDITVPNGLAWSPDGETMYFADSPRRTIWAFPFDPATGALGPRRVFATVPEAAGFPDGATVDAAGYLWSAHFDGWRLTRYAPDGRVDRVVPLPVQRPTSCAFGGPDLDVLYVTSASMRLGFWARRAQPAAGGLLALAPGVRGLPEPRFAG